MVCRTDGVLVVFVSPSSSPSASTAATDSSVFSDKTSQHRHQTSLEIGRSSVDAEDSAEVFGRMFGSTRQGLYYSAENFTKVRCLTFRSQKNSQITTVLFHRIELIFSDERQAQQ